MQVPENNNSDVIKGYIIIDCICISIRPMCDCCYAVANVCNIKYI